ncbi:ricin-type beta-trefoil lectin domain protein [Streptomyces sp. CB03911]|uniref:glycoside hydrolase family 27 protein n=1 Tax=Streptomyces sp. CB03911 TaxID=1804758 RepID=UPI00093B26B4|nr:ricin-type beta-trefoil lectin domain protein [Streptomyces sp. CB03911]OKI17685.1 alpha-galactosidase [Streptomyces sp. CB03911]
MPARHSARFALRSKTSALAALAAFALLVPAVPAAALTSASPGAAASGPASAAPVTAGEPIAPTPPMGYNNWNATGCAVSESLIKASADAMHRNGMQAAGYTYVNIDDCWMAPGRDAAGNLVPDPGKFPNGIAAVADHVHALGLKLGIYEDSGTKTCAGLPGSLGHESQDAALFASWGVDLLKYDNCNNTGLPSKPRYTAMRDALRATGRPILFSLCNWGQESPWLWGADTGSMWRTTLDIHASFSSILSIFHRNVGLGAYAGPGHWNDPDMLEVGNGMSAAEDRSHFGLWSMMAAPLLAGNDITKASAETLAILTNTRVIAVNQDPLGRQAHLVSSADGHNVLAKPLANGDVAVALFNGSDAPATITTTTGTVGKSGASSYTLTDLWSGEAGNTTGTVTATLPAHATAMFRLSGGNTPVLDAGVLNGAGSGRCIDVPKGSTSPGVRLTIWDCNGGSGQVFTRTADKQLTVYEGAARLCLATEGGRTVAGTRVVTAPCNAGTGQQWAFGAGTITAVGSGLCLDVDGARTDKGAPLQLWQCNGGSNQKFALS